MSIDDLSRSRLPLLDPDQLRSFVAIAENGNLTRAAEAVFRTPSAISMQLKKLEEALETKVLFRTSREVSLTPDGEQLLAYARRLLALNREAVLQFRKPALEGVVRIGAPDDYGVRLLPNVLRRFSECYPGVMLDVGRTPCTGEQGRSGRTPCLGRGQGRMCVSAASAAGVDVGAGLFLAWQCGSGS